MAEKEVTLYNVGKRQIGYKNLAGVQAILKAGNSAKMTESEAKKLLKLYAKEVSDSKAVEGSTVKDLRAEVKALTAENSALKAEIEVLKTEIESLKAEAPKTADNAKK